jgi:hypothetical protein
MPVSSELKNVVGRLSKRGLLWTCKDTELARIVKADARTSVVDELIVIGVRSAASSIARSRPEQKNARAQARQDRKKMEGLNREYAAKHGIPVEDASAHRNKGIMDELNSVHDKAAKLDRVVALFDIWNVGGKKLGDCTRNDLVKASRAAESKASILNENAGVYKKLSALLDQGKTVRASSRRHDILDVLMEACEDVA